MTVGPPSHGSGGTSALMPTLVQKELRALAPVFTATAVLVALCRVGLESELMTLGMGVYVLGAAALGALSIGHEFTHDTLGQLLAQPGRRARLLTAKLLVLAALLGLLAAAATVTVWPWIERGFVGVGHSDKTEAVRWPMVLIPVLLAAFVAPLLTMLSRSAIAGTVFTVGVYAGLWLIAPGITSLTFPEEGVDIEFYAGTILWIAVGVSAMSAVAVAVMFRRLEYTGSHSAMAWSAGRRRESSTERVATGTARLPALVLLRKELRLQTVSFVIAGLYVALWALYTLTGSHSTEVVYAFEGGTLLYQFILAMLIGALASAEERALGTLPWQVLQPYATWKQWAIKSTTALTLTVLLVLALPALNAIGADVVDRFWFPVRVHWSLSTLVESGQLWSNVVILVAAVTTALFASSFNRSSLHALLTTGLLLFIGGLAIGTAFVAGTSAVWEGLDLNTFYHRLATSGPAEALWGKTWTPADDLWTKGITLVVVVAAIVGFLLLMLRAGLKNYRSAETPRGVVTRQVLWLLAFCIAACLLVGGGQPALQYYLITR